MDARQGPAHQLERRLVEFLQSKGYPEESLLHGIRITDTPGLDFEVDLVAVHLATKEVLAVFEVKEAGDTIPPTLLTNLFQLSQGRPYSAYVVLPDASSPGLKIRAVTGSNNYEALDLGSFPAYSETTQAQIIAAIEKPERLAQSKRKKLDHLQIISTIMAFLGLVLAFLDAFNVYQLSAERLALFTAVGVFILIPYFESIKFSNVELKRVLSKPDRTVEPQG